MSTNLFKRCTRCVMDTSDPYIRFDAKGYCNHCTCYIDKISKLVFENGQRNKNLQQLVEKIKKAGRGKKYDCVVGVSGGADSSYTAFIIRELGLRALLVHMDSGWDTAVAVSNIRNLIDKLELDYQSYVLDWEEFKKLQLAFLKASVPEIETPTDHAIVSAVHSVAAHYKIRYLISGSSTVAEGIFPDCWHYDRKDVKFMKSVYRKFCSARLKKFPLFGFWQELVYKYYYRIKTIYLLDLLPYDNKKAQHTLTEKLGWKEYGGKHYESAYTRFIHACVLPVKFDIDYRKIVFSIDICSGKMTRQEAIEQLSILPYDPATLEQEKEYICRKLDITIEELEEILAAPVKSYSHYPNNQKKLEYMYNLYRKITRLLPGRFSKK